MGFLRLLLLLPLVSLLPITSMASFKCSLNSTCNAIVDYVSPNSTTLSEIAALFQVEELSILGANSLPSSTPGNHSIAAKQKIKISFPCLCRNGTGVSNHMPNYTVVLNDAFYHIAAEVFSGLMTYQEIAALNTIPYSQDILYVGQTLWIPLPCSCDEVGGEKVVHYGYIVPSGSSVSQIAKKYGTTEETLMSINNLTKASDLKAGQVLDVPLKACTSEVNSTSLDYPLLVSNGTYVFTANKCVMCKCNAANNYTLQCQPSKLELSKWSTCPSMKCLGSSNFSLGNSSTVSSCSSTTCAYAGYTDQGILTTLAQDSTCPVGSKHRTFIVILISALVVVVVASLLTYALCKCSTKKKVTRNISGELASENNLEQADTNELPTFDFVKILAATDGFSMANKIGEGGFGHVFKGMLQDGQEIAVKRLLSHAGQGINEFRNEILLISKLQHRNLVKILGCSIKGEEKLIVYEYLPNKSLDTYLFDSRKRKQLNWALRFNIIQGVARGLTYLHQDSRVRVIHRDMKASNILLDHDMNPKISDFGLARAFQAMQKSANTLRVVGTFGYMSPEYAMGGIFSEKSDVFSFGVLILEIVSGIKNNSFSYLDQDLSLINHAWRAWNEGRGLEVVDESMQGVYSEHEALRCINVGLLCVQDHAEDRPTMSNVVLMLSSETSLPWPKQPTFVPQIQSRSSDLDGICSQNEVTVSEVEGR